MARAWLETMDIVRYLKVHFSGEAFGQILLGMLGITVSFIFVLQIARGLGLTCVGWIFTDLVPLDANNGTVRHLRHAGTYFLSAHEVIMAAHLQHLHPNPCRLSPEGRFGSKFVTVIVTGDQNNQVSEISIVTCLAEIIC